MIEAKAPQPEQKESEEKKTVQARVKTGIECLEVPITAHHGDPPTAIVVDALPFDCYGERLRPPDLPGLGAGAVEGLKEAADITLPVTATYNLAGHTLWIERARATPKGKGSPVYTLEIVCTLLSRSAVCWLAQAGDEAGLNTFEQSPVSLDGVLAPRLVPSNVFVKSE